LLDQGGLSSYLSRLFKIAEGIVKPRERKSALIRATLFNITSRWWEMIDMHQVFKLTLGSFQEEFLELELIQS